MPPSERENLIAEARKVAGDLREAAEWRRAMRGAEIADPADAERLAGYFDRLAAALQVADATNKRLNRRCNEYEGALREKLRTAEELAGSRTFGRVLANSAATVFADDADVLREVLRFYADPHHYGESDYGELPAVIADRGTRAREALEPDAWQRWRSKWPDLVAEAEAARAAEEPTR